MNPFSRILAALASIVGFYGCDGQHLAALQPGTSTVQEVHARLGAPAAEWPNDDGSVTLEYPRGPQGTQCWMLTVDSRGILQGIEQALTEANLARVEKGWRAEQVRRLLGRPGSETPFPLKPEVVWEWRVEPRLPGSFAFFHVHFSPDGIVTETSRREDSPG